MKKNYKFYEYEILSAIEKIENYVGIMSLGEFYDDEKTFDACCMQLQHIGECGIKLRALTSKNYKNIPFNEMSAFRNRISHDYMGIDEDVVWEVIKKYLPALKMLLID